MRRQTAAHRKERLVRPDKRIPASARYRGEAAEHYDSIRTQGRKWRREQEIVQELLSALAGGNDILDVPLGTGRFLEIYQELGLIPVGLDISEDMLQVANEKASEQACDLRTCVSDVKSIPFLNGAFDGVICIRLFNLIPLEECQRALEELARVSRCHVIIGIRHYVPLLDIASRYGPKALVTLPTQLLRRLIGIKGQAVHRKHDVAAMFQRNGLVVSAAKTVELRRDGTEYCIYLLLRDESAAASGGLPPYTSSG